MAIYHVLDREFNGAFKTPKFLVVGEEHGQVIRRVYRSEGTARRFADKIRATPGVRNVAVVAYPK